MVQATPAGAFGLLVPALVAGLLIGWRHGRAAVVLWAALAMSMVLWWINFRDLRYVVPTALVAIVLLLWNTRGWRPSRTVTGALLAAAALATVVYLPSTVASFWNVPRRTLPFAAAFGRWDKESYLREAFLEKAALDAYVRLAPPGADAISDPQERLFVRDRDLSPTWEVARLLDLSGPPPTAPDDTYRRLRRLGIGWAIIDPRQLFTNVAWLAPLLAEHGEEVFADRGWVLYRLVASPRPVTGRRVDWPGDR
jgi:hypothetical protein